MVAFRVPVDIANRALQHCGASRIDPLQGFNEVSKNASEISFCYDKLREAELQRRVWTFATRRQVIRALDTNTMLLTPSLWSQTTSYFVGSIVADQVGSLWISRVTNNIGFDPLLTTVWEPYFGPLTVPLNDSTLAYFAGELVYTTPGDGTALIYLSLQNNNSDVPGTATAYDPTVTYFKNQVVTFASVAYMSLVDLNLNNEPDLAPSLWTTAFVGGTGSDKWLLIGGSAFPAGVGLTTLNIVYPLGCGPSSQIESNNVFRLPAGYLRLAPQNPKPGIGALGGPTGVDYDDWLIEGDYLISSQGGPIPLRFVVNITDVSRMHTMFCEALAGRIGLEVCEPLTQSSAKLQTIAKIYTQWVSEAGIIDAIEDGYVDAPDDELITVRL